MQTKRKITSTDCCKSGTEAHIEIIWLMEVADARLSTFRFDFERNAVADFQEREPENCLQRIEMEYVDVSNGISLSGSRFFAHFFRLFFQNVYSNVGIFRSM